MLKIAKVLNHNVVMCQDTARTKLIAFGAGIGFRAKEGDILDESRVENLYTLEDTRRYEQLVCDAKDQIVLLSETIIRQLKEEFSCDFDQNIHVTLLDHLNFAYKRYQEGVVVPNMFLSDIAYFYPKEYAFATRALTTLNQQLEIELPREEAGYLCMHIHAALHHVDLSFTNLVLLVTTDILHLIETTLNIDLSQYADHRQRLMTHIRFAVIRSLKHKELENDLQEIIQGRYVRAFSLAQQIAQMVKDKYALVLNEAELAYLALHLENIIRTITA